MRKPLLTLAAGMLLALSASAIPARRVPVVVTQPDGTTVTVMLSGDESLHFYETADGVPVAKNASGAYCYATLQGQLLVPSTLLAHDAHLRSDSERLFLTQHADVAPRLRSLGIERLQARNADRAKAPQKVGKPGVTTGKRKGLVILVNFQDKKMNANNTREQFDRMMNEVGYHDNGNAGSVHDYFLAQSYGKFDLTFDVVGPVTVSKNLADYGGNYGPMGDDVDPQGMVYEACQLAAPQVDFSQYDWDGDGEVDQVFVICAGNSEAAGGASDCIWPHESKLGKTTYGKLHFNGVDIDTYGCSTELYGTSDSQMDGIGVSCHEFSHCMGLPDFYDKNYGGGFGMGHWSVMSSGSYNGDGYVPAGYNAYERWFSGWLEPKVLQDACTVNALPSLDTHPEAYVVYSEANPNEFYMIENRQQDGWFAKDATHGMLVTHVDYVESLWADNNVNVSKTTPHCTVLAADNSLLAADEAGDLYPNGGLNTALTSLSLPAATLYATQPDGTNNMGKPITDITEKDGLISFNFKGGDVLPAPKAVACQMNGTAANVSWMDVEGADAYDVELQAIGATDADKALLGAEDLGMMGMNVTDDPDTDISKRLNDNGTSIGWGGERIYLGDLGLKVGNEDHNGLLTTPLYAAPSTGAVTLSVAISPESNVSNTLSVQLQDAQGNTLQSQTITPTDDTHTLHFEGVNKDFRLAFTTSKEYVYFSGLCAVFNGTFSADQLEQALDQTDVQPKVVKAAAEPAASIEGLVAGKTYLLKVRAHKTCQTSAWSAPMAVTAGTADGISEAGAQESLWQSTTPVKVYTIAGQLLRTTTYARWSNGLPTGAYVLRSAQAAKVALTR